MYVVIELTGGCVNSASVFSGKTDHVDAVEFAKRLLAEQDNFSAEQMQAAGEQLCSTGSYEVGDYEVVVVLADNRTAGK